jgi:hypothetical protein
MRRSQRYRARKKAAVRRGRSVVEASTMSECWRAKGLTA